MTKLSFSNQLLNRPAFAQNPQRPLSRVVEFVVVVDAEDMVHGREDIAGAGGAGGGVFGTGIGGADHLAHAQAAAGEDDGHGDRPVIAAGSGVDARSAAELAVR